MIYIEISLFLIVRIGKGPLAWYGKLTLEYNFNMYSAFEFLCNSIANL